VTGYYRKYTMSTGDHGAGRVVVLGVVLGLTEIAPAYWQFQRAVWGLL
jgi:hypothetical protein